MPAFLARNAFSATFLAAVAANVAGTPICTNACVILPAAVFSAVSSNIFILSRYPKNG